MSAQTPRDILLAAADHCDLTGLHKGELWPSGEDEIGPYVEGDPCCAEGHLRVAADVPGALELAGPAAEAMDWLGEVVGPLVHRWSDRPERTASEVADALRAAAERAT